MDLGKLAEPYSDDYEGPDRDVQQPGARKPKFKLPKGYESEAQFLAEMRQVYIYGVFVWADPSAFHNLFCDRTAHYVS